MPLATVRILKIVLDDRGILYATKRDVAVTMSGADTAKETKASSGLAPGNWQGRLMSSAANPPSFALCTAALKRELTCWYNSARVAIAKEGAHGACGRWH